MIDHTFYSRSLIIKLSNEKSDDLLAIFRIGPPEHDRFPNFRMYDEVILEFCRRNIGAAANDQIRSAALNKPMSLRVDTK